MICFYFYIYLLPILSINTSPKKSGASFYCHLLLFITSKIQDGRIKGCTLIFSCKNTKSQTVAKQPLTGECGPTKKDTPHTRAKEKPQQDDRRAQSH